MTQQPQQSGSAFFLLLVGLGCLAVYSQPAAELPPPAPVSPVTPTPEPQEPSEPAADEPVVKDSLTTEPDHVPDATKLIEPTRSIVLVTTSGCAPCERIKQTLPVDGFACYVLADDDPRTKALHASPIEAFPFVLVFDQVKPDGSTKPLFADVVTPDDFPLLVERFKQ